VVVFLVRFARARGERRTTLRALLLAMVPPLTILGFSQIPDLRGTWAWLADLVAFPALSLPPLATAYAFVRHDLWGSRALLSRILTNVLVIAVVGLLSVGLGTALATELGAALPAALAGAAAAGVIAAISVAAALAAVERRLFPALAQYKPTIEQLSQELIHITSPEQVARAIEHNVERWLPCESVQLRLEPLAPALGSIAPARPPGQDDARASAGEIVLPVTFGAERLGLLHLGRKRGGALFSYDDLDLLHTIVNQGALALAHAHAYRELEARRRQQAAAWRGEREALVETVAAEIAHEVRYPLNFFRTSFERLARGVALDAEDVDIGREEIDRLERMVAGLRKMAAHRMQRRHVKLCELCERAEVLLRDTLGERSIPVDADPDVELRCDSDQATQILVNLLANALEAAGPEGDWGIELEHLSAGAELRVWDSGSGFVGDASRLFAPWYTTKERGTGLGLAITHRLVRAHGWSIVATRGQSRTVFSIGIPPVDVRSGRAEISQKVEVA
jgi:signal transduction histidine kinase